MLRPAYKRAGAAAIAVIAGLACADATGIQYGPVQVSMRQSAAVGMFAAPDAFQAGSETFSLDLSQVSSFTVWFASVEFLPAVQAGEQPEATGWQAVDLGDLSLDLLALPGEGESPVVIVSGSAPVGAYRSVRFVVDSAFVTLAEDVTRGGFTFPAGEPIAALVPSGAASGLKTDVAFEVMADGEGNVADVEVWFGPDATFQNVTATGNGAIILAPVIKAHPGGSE